MKGRVASHTMDAEPRERTAGCERSGGSGKEEPCRQDSRPPPWTTLNLPMPPKPPPFFLLSLFLDVIAGRHQSTSHMHKASRKPSSSPLPPPLLPVSCQQLWKRPGPSVATSFPSFFRLSFRRIEEDKPSVCACLDPGWSVRLRRTENRTSRLILQAE